MPSLGRVSQKIAELLKLRDDLQLPASLEALKVALSDPSNYVVVKAADLIAESENQQFIPDLEKSYRRLLINPLKKDPGCGGKIAIVAALVKLEYRELDFFRQGLNYQQLEYAFEDREDTAAQLRAECAFGLLGCDSLSSSLLHFSELLADKWKLARIGAARAIAALSSLDGVPLLRLKILIGDNDPEVLGECCTALLSLQRDDAIDFVAQLLSSDDSDFSVQAAFALGSSRNSKAFAPLVDRWKTARDGSLKNLLIVCISLIRSTESNEYLLSLIRNDDGFNAVGAIGALAVFRHEKDLLKQVKAAVEAAGNADNLAFFEKEFRQK